MFAIRIINLCTKDCMCLFVCPTGATDTEDGQIDAEKCLDGCRLCVDACSSGAISLVYQRYPKPKSPDEDVAKHLLELLRTRAHFIKDLTNAETKTKAEEIIRKALMHSFQVAAEDYVREMGFMIPQSEVLREFQADSIVEDLYAESADTKPAVNLLLDESSNAIDNFQDAPARGIKVCTDCGFIAIEEGVTVCPHCSADAIIEV